MIQAPFDQLMIFNRLPKQQVFIKTAKAFFPHTKAPKISTKLHKNKLNVAV